MTEAKPMTKKTIVSSIPSRDKHKLVMFGNHEKSHIEEIIDNPYFKPQPEPSYNWGKEMNDDRPMSVREVMDALMRESGGHLSTPVECPIMDKHGYIIDGPCLFVEKISYSDGSLKSVRIRGKS